jgi:hypothetical protein
VTAGAVYGIQDPFTLELRYIGATKKKLGQRLAGHVYRARVSAPSQQAFRDWICSVLERGARPLIFEIEKLETADELAEAEIFWIAYWRGVGANLTNVAIGGRGVSMIGRDARLAIAACKIGTKMTPEQRAANAARLKAAWATPEHRERHQAGIDRYLRDGDKISKTLKERWADPEYRAAMEEKLKKSAAQRHATLRRRNGRPMICINLLPPPPA